MEGRADVGGLIHRVRSAAGEDMVPSRQAAEAEARELLDRAAGHMSVEQVEGLTHILNRGSWGGAMKHNRFLPAFSAPLIEQMTADLDLFNDLTQTLWRGSEEQALEAADRIYRDRSVLPGSGRSYPSVLMYLRDPQRFPIWFDSLDRGLALLTDYEERSREEGSAGYLAFAEAAATFAAEYRLEAQALDAVLAQAVRDETQRRATDRRQLETPTITHGAFEFLRDLSENNNKQWFDDNRHRYEADLRDPLAAVFQEVADRYIVGLDPKINAEVKRDAVLARMNKYSSGDPYYTYLWGSFSRGKKQEDVQLYINIDAEVLHFGLFLASAQPEARDALTEAFEQTDDASVRSIVDRLPERAEWDPDDPFEPMEVADVSSAVQWSKSRKPHLRIVLDAEDPLIGSPELVPTIGEFLVAVHPLAAVAWGDGVLDESATADVGETVRPEYTFEELVRDTLLSRDRLQEWIDLLRGPKRAALLFGPPGTGKTHVAEKLARYLAGTDGETRTVQFHPSFSYEDFIEGLRPEMNDGQLGYSIRPGVFHDFCEAARGKDGDFVFVIDEINRAELGSILGEVMMLIEYRDRAVPLPYSQRNFSIPRNVVLLATMNTADRSLALVDFALRRRFHAFQMLPDRDVLASWSTHGGALAVKMFELVQKHVADNDYAPGHTYWMVDDQSPQALLRLWHYELQPYLSEYWFESKGRLVELEKEVLELLAEGA